MKAVSHMIRIFDGFCNKAERHFNYWRAIDQCALGKGTQIIGKGSVCNYQKIKNNILLGKNTILAGELASFCSDGIISIGSDVFIGPNSHIMAFKSITIGDRVQISHNVNICDSNSHSLSAQNRFIHMKTIVSKGHPPFVDDLEIQPITIDDDVWIGFGSAILKGVHIGKGAIIGACSVITKDVPAYSIVVGNPQRISGQARE
jgi:acetyltransferase-like isoleucine patch superfamily enzyme